MSDGDLLGDGKPEPAPPPGHLGHRKRLRDRFLKGGADALPDYELLELLLFPALPRRDTKPLARELLRRFGSFEGVVTAPVDALLTVSGMGESAAVALKAVAAGAVRLAREQVMDQPVMNSWDKVLGYLRTSIGRSPVEQVRLLFLDRKNRLIADEGHQVGTVDHTPLYPREVVKRALELGASALILVHNHPSGDSKPSKADIEMIRQVADAAQRLGIALHDHIIIARAGHSSFRGLGLL